MATKKPAKRSAHLKKGKKLEKTETLKTSSVATMCSTGKHMLNPVIT